MVYKKLYYNSTLKLLKSNPNYILVRGGYYSSWIVDKYGEEEGYNISTKITDKLLNNGKLYWVGQGSGLTDHWNYYKLRV